MTTNAVHSVQVFHGAAGEPLTEISHHVYQGGFTIEHHRDHRIDCRFKVLMMGGKPNIQLDDLICVNVDGHGVFSGWVRHVIRSMEEFSEFSLDVEACSSASARENAAPIQVSWHEEDEPVRCGPLHPAITGYVSEVETGETALERFRGIVRETAQERLKGMARETKRTRIEVQSIEKRKRIIRREDL